MANKSNSRSVRPSVFIGSSKEHIELARAVQEELEPELETKVWDQDVFRPSTYPLEALLAELQHSDFGIFVLAPSDVTVIRGERRLAPRDNVVFELGLFTGQLGKDRAFVIAPRGVPDLRLPTDLVGLTVGEYDADRADRNLTAAVGSACNKIRKAIRAREAKPPHRGGATQTVLFSDLAASFDDLILNSKEISLYFIHSRRWRENHNDALRSFSKRPKSRLIVFLPDIRYQPLMQALREHFDDGPYILGFIADAYRYFGSLARDFPQNVSINLFSLYPTYSFYQFDDTIIAAMYPTTLRRKSVPSFRVSKDDVLGQFVRDDIDQLLSTCLTVEPRELAKLEKLASEVSPPTRPRVRKGRTVSDRAK